MGDMADMLMEQEWQSEYYDENPKRPTCRYCGTKNLVWRRAYGRWTLWDGEGLKMHVCPVTRKQKEIKVDKKFYILWNPEGRTPPTARFNTYDEAAKVAEAMQKRIGLGTMYVMEAKQSFTVFQKTKWEGLK